MAEQILEKPKTKEPSKEQSKTQAPVGAPTPPPRSQWQVEAEAYLESRGWEMIGYDASNIPWYADPRGILTRAVDEEYSLPNQEGGFDTFKRKIGGLSPWDYTIHQAVDIQKSRDKDGDGDKTPMVRLQELHRKYDKLAATHDNLLAAIKMFVYAPTPANVQEWTVWRQRVSTAMDVAMSIKDAA